MRKNVLFLSLAAVATLAACSSDDGNDNITGPDSAACTRGVLRTGQTVTGAISAADCKFEDTADNFSGDSLLSESYSVRLEQGRSYVFYLRDVDEVGQDFDTGLSLYGSSGLVAYSDDEGGGVLNGHNSQLAFVAPTTGNYSVRVHGYSDADSGSYALTAQTCGAAPTVTDAPINGAIAAGDCVVHNLWDDFDEADSSRVDFYKVSLAAGQQVTVRVQSTAFDPFLSISGPGFDAQANLDGDYDYSWGTSPVTVTYTANLAGQYTIMVAPTPETETFGTTGAYTIDIEPNPTAAASLSRSAPARQVKQAKR